MKDAARLKEIRDTVADVGVDEAARVLGLKRETVRRRMRNDPLDNREAAKPVDALPADTMAAKLVERFSEAELKAILDDSGKFFPKARATRYDFSGEWVKFGVLSDIHAGSNYLDEDKVASAIEECNAEGCEFLALTGDVTEGMSGRDGHLYELTHRGYREQRDAAVRLLSPFKGKIKAISGNHDLWYMQKANMGGVIVEDICRLLGDRAEYLGEHEGQIFLNGARVDLWHGIDGASYAISYRIQKIIESLGEDALPQMIIAGHDHKAEFIPDLRGIYALEGGCIQGQTPFMRGKKLRAFVGFWIVELCIRDGKIVRARCEWNTFTKKGKVKR